MNDLPSGSAHRTAASRWPACTGWLPGSRRPLQARHTSCPGKVPAQHRAASHRTCPACCPAWTRCWSRSLQSWCWHQRPAEGSPPESHAPSCRSRARCGGGTGGQGVRREEQNRIKWKAHGVIRIFDDGDAVKMTTGERGVKSRRHKRELQGEWGWSAFQQGRDWAWLILHVTACVQGCKKPLELGPAPTEKLASLLFFGDRSVCFLENTSLPLQLWIQGGLKECESNVQVSQRTLPLRFSQRKPSLDTLRAFSPSGLCGRCSLCGSSGQQRQSVGTKEDKPEFRAAAVLQVSAGETWPSLFVPVEIWLWLQPPSSSHETRGSQTLHLRDDTNTELRAARHSHHGTDGSVSSIKFHSHVHLSSENAKALFFVQCYTGEDIFAQCKGIKVNTKRQQGQGETANPAPSSSRHRQIEENPKIWWETNEKDEATFYESSNLPSEFRSKKST